MSCTSQITQLKKFENECRVVATVASRALFIQYIGLASAIVWLEAVCQFRVVSRNFPNDNSSKKFASHDRIVAASRALFIPYKVL